MANIIYRQMPDPQDLPQQIPPPLGKAWMQKPQSGGKFFVQIPGSAWGDDYQDEIDTCIAIEFAHRMLQKVIVNKLPNVRKQF